METQTLSPSRSHLGTDQIPSSTAACGALGRADRARVLAMARRFERVPEIVHSDPESILALDREPIRWEGRDQRGLGWEEQPGSFSGAAGSWQDASAGAAGLVIAGRDRHVHSTISAIAPVYFIAEDEAVYFATTIDALVASSDRRLSIDWEAWSSILTLGYPLGDRTPFAEIRRLGPSSLLSAGATGAKVSVDRWPWAEVDPVLDVNAGAPAVLEAMRAAIARLDPGAVLCQLSGGLDSRLCLGLLAEGRATELGAVTVDEDNGIDSNQRVAAMVATALGVRHEIAVAEPESYWDELTTLARRLDYQYARPPWRMPMLVPFKQEPATVVDGFGFDTLATPGDRFLPPSTADPRGGDDVVRALWDSMGRRRKRPGATGLRDELAEPLWELAREQLMAESDRLRGHPLRAMLTFYLTKQARAVAQVPRCGLGTETRVAMPLIADGVARATLAISQESKRGGHLYHAILTELEPRLTRIPTARQSVYDAYEGGLPHPRRSQTALVADAFDAALANGPLTPHLRPGKVRTLRRHRRDASPRTPMALLGPVVFHLWHQRYRDRLSELDPGDLLDQRGSGARTRGATSA